MPRRQGAPAIAAVRIELADEPSDWVHEFWTEEPYDFTDQGWAYAGTLWGYWDDLGGKPLTENDFVRVDDIYIANAWINPPF